MSNTQLLDYCLTRGLIWPIEKGSYCSHANFFTGEQCSNKAFFGHNERMCITHSVNSCKKLINDW